MNLYRITWKIPASQKHRFPGSTEILVYVRAENTAHALVRGSISINISLDVYVDVLNDNTIKQVEDENVTIYLQVF